MTPCQNCGKPLLCSCEIKQSTGIVKSCPKKEPALWVLVMTPDGKGVEGVSVSNGESKVARTSSAGVHEFENTVNQKYTISVTKLMDKDNERYDLPESPSIEVTPTPGTVTQVLFTLRTKAKLRVELIPGGNFVLPKAEVVLHRIVSKEYRDKRTHVVLAEVAKKPHAGGKVDFESKPAEEYRITVVFEKAQEKEYGAYDVDFELLAGEDKLVKVEIERYFKKVRFIGYCIATVPRQVWTGTQQSLIDYEQAKAMGSIAVPDPNDKPAYIAFLASHWADFSGKELWKGRYNGPYSDADDIVARIDLLREAIRLASANLDDETELKVFVAPECYFLGRYGAYEHAAFGSLIQGLQELVGGAEWKSWVFAFGTANGVYDLEGRKEVFNVTPVVKGGWKGKGDDPSRYTRLMQKYLFSQEMLGQSDVDHIEPQKHLLTRTQITEDLVGKDFQATHNEELIGIKIREVLEDIESQGIRAKTQINDWILQRWERIRDAAREEIRVKGLTAVVRRIRVIKTNPNRRMPAALPEDWSADLRYLLSLPVYFTAEFELTATKGKLDNLIFEDSSFSCMRMPGPLLDDVVLGEDTSRRHTKLTFGTETCADHNKTRLARAAASVAPHEKPDIHLVVSAGMAFSAPSVVVVKKGLAFNCDGWNPLTMFGVTASKRGGKFIIEENHLAPRRSGNNPIVPHTELWLDDGQGNFTYITANIEVKPVARDASNIFMYRNAEERKAYAEERSKIPRMLELLPFQGDIVEQNWVIEEKTKSLLFQGKDLLKKQQALQQKELEVRQIELEKKEKEEGVQQAELEKTEKDEEVYLLELAVQKKELEVQQLTSAQSIPKPTPEEEQNLETANIELEAEKQKVEVAKIELEEEKQKVEVAKKELGQVVQKLKVPKTQVETTMPKGILTTTTLIQKLERELRAAQDKVEEYKQAIIKIEQGPANANAVPEEPAKGGELHIYPSQDLPVNY